MEKTDKQKKASDKKLRQLNRYARFSGLAFQLVAIIGLLTWIGYWFDKRLVHNVPVLTILFSLIALIAAMLVLYRELDRNK